MEMGTSSNSQEKLHIHVSAAGLFSFTYMASVLQIPIVCNSTNIEYILDMVKKRLASNTEAAVQLCGPS